MPLKKRLPTLPTRGFIVPGKGYAEPWWVRWNRETGSQLTRQDALRMRAKVQPGGWNGQA